MEDPDEPPSTSNKHSSARIDAKIQAPSNTPISHSDASRARLPGIFRLPPEILSDIFLILCRQSPHLSKWFALRPVTHVCWRWRNIALDSAILWTHVDSRYTGFKIDAFVGRSKAAPLDAYLHHTFTKHQYTTTSILAKLSQIRSLCVVMPQKKYLWRLYHKFLTSAAPRLERLELYSIGRCQVPPPEQRQLLFGNSSPLLKSVVLQNVCLPWDSKILRCLSEFSLESIPHESQPSLSEILHILESCPKLEILRLVRVGPRLTAEMPPSSPIDLPCLRQLQLEMAASTCKTVLSHLALPPTAALSVFCTDYPVGDPISILPLSTSAGAAAENLSFECDLHIDWMVVRASILRTPASGPREVASLKADWSSEPRTSSPEHDTFNTLATLISTSGLRNAVHFSFNIGGGRHFYIHMTSWCKLLATLPRLKSLHVHNNRYDWSTLEVTEEGLAEALAMPAPSGAPLCPDLSVIRLKDETFSHLTGCFLDKLKICVEYRRVFGKPLTQLVMEDCDGILTWDAQQLALFTGTGT